MYVANGNNVTTAEEMKQAIDEGLDVGCCEVAVVDVNADQSELQKVKHKWSGINSITNLELHDNSITQYKAYNIGNGKLVDNVNSLCSTDLSQALPNLTIIRPFTTPKAHTGKISKPKENSVLSSDLENSIFVCTETGCICSFKSFSDFKRHRDFENMYINLKRCQRDRTGKKANPNAVAKILKTAMNKDGERLFTLKQCLQPSQIMSYFSRLALLTTTGKKVDRTVRIADVYIDDDNLVDILNDIEMDHVREQISHTTKLLFSVNGEVKELDINTGNVTTLVDIASTIYSMAYDYGNQYLYIPRHNRNDIIRLRYPSEHTLTFEAIVNTQSPATVAMDQQNEHLYWTEYTDPGRIRRSNFDGTFTKTILPESYPWALTIDLENRWIYFSTYLNRAIKRARFNGTEMQTIAAPINLVTSLHLDNNKNRLYFMELDSGDIKSANTDGSNLTNIFSTGSRFENHNLVVNGDYIYCTNDSQILKLLKNPGSPARILHTESEHISSVLVYIENGNYH
ncbi:unnamed protein product [Mytilus coruscus]|uniref:LRP5_6 n=1 Tax=Mytilus coruscus TaxID=42192 RepID=A0A6J8E7L1_MYTCO|nr:unnamed protein product [Mytilus coruscus]